MFLIFKIKYFYDKTSLNIYEDKTYLKLIKKQSYIICSLIFKFSLLKFCLFCFFFPTYNIYKYKERL